MEKRRTILVVDDTPDNIAILRDILNKTYKVKVVTTGEKALKIAFSDTPPDLILLDILMPEMDGYEVCQRLKSNDTTKEIPVIFISALSQTIDKVKAFKNGGVDYVTKPFQTEEVLARVNSHLEIKFSRQNLKDSYEKLQELEQLRDNLVHMVVHDMRSPLTVLLSRIEFLKHDLAGQINCQNMKDINGVLNAGHQLNQMTNDLLDVSRLEQRQMILEKTRCDLLELVIKSIENTTQLDPERDIQIDAPEKLEIECDQGLIMRVIINLIGNGLKHTPGDHPLIVSIKKQPGGVWIGVQDQGEGVPEEFREKIFKKFGTIKASHNQKYHSAGLGLAFCKLAVAAHNGKIGLDSVEGKGSTFYFTLPKTMPDLNYINKG